MNGDKEMVSKAVYAGADVNEEIKTALEYASVNKNYEMCQYFMCHSQLLSILSPSSLLPRLETQNFTI